MIAAHRGARREAPENTRAAFDAALAHGVAGLEFDVQLSRDGIPVIYHDRTLSRIGKGRRRISNYSLEDLQTFDWGGWFHRSFRGEPLMTLDQVLERYCRRTRLLIEVKSRSYDRASGRGIALAGTVLEAVRRGVPEERLNDIFILSFDPEVLRTVSSEEPRWKYILNVETPDDFAMRKRPRDVPLYGCSLPVRNLTKAFTRRVHNGGLRLVTYAVNAPRQAARALGAGVDIILTDDPGRLLRHLKERGVIS
jgi:glycerophosphoryl diester phosphodiesterase